jgi:hypothetical protein
MLRALLSSGSSRLRIDALAATSMTVFAVLLFFGPFGKKTKPLN